MSYKKLGLAATFILTVVGLGLSSSTVLAQSNGTTASAAGPSVIPREPVIDLNERGKPEMLYTQAFRLQDCTLTPTGNNRFFDHLLPGFTHVSFVSKDEGDFRKEYRVLDQTEQFNLSGIGKFKAAVIEEREFLDGVLIQISNNWYTRCKETNSIFAVGENSFELDPAGDVTSTEGTWRAGEVNDQGEVAIPSMAMPGTVLLGSLYIFDGAPGIALGGAEIVAYGLKTRNGKLTTHETDFYEGEKNIPIPITNSIGDIRGCVQVEEISQDSETRRPAFDDVTNKVWCPNVGLIYDTSDGALIESNRNGLGSP